MPCTPDNSQNPSDRNAMNEDQREDRATQWRVSH